MTDLYATLDVPRDATPAAIRAAYRRRAKTAHPDAGGTADGFSNLGRAMKVLMDPARREHYDRTGKVEDVPSGTPEGRAREFAFSALHAVIGGCANQGRDPATVDLVEAAVTAIRTTMGENKRKHAAAMKDVEKARKLGRRLKARRGKNGILVAMWENNILGMEQQAAKLTADAPAMERAIEILKDHRFEKEPEEARVMMNPSIFWNTATGTGGAF